MSRIYLRDTAERVALTFAQAFLAALVVLDVAGVKAAGAAGVAAVLSLAKALIAQRLGDPTSASLDPSV